MSHFQRLCKCVNAYVCKRHGVHIYIYYTLDDKSSLEKRCKGNPHVCLLVTLLF